MADPFIAAPRKPKPHKPYEVFMLPKTPADWNSSKKMDGVTVNSLPNADSASDIRLPQFLTLRALWPNQTKKSALMDFLVQLGFEQSKYEEKEEIMMQNKAWRAYIEVLEANFKKPRSRPHRSSTGFPDDVGRFEIALENQLEISEDNMHKKQGTKTTLTSESSLRPLRSRQQASPLPNTPQRPFRFADVDHRTPGSPSQPRPPRAQDETIVNVALIAFLQAIWRLDPKLDTRWTAHRKAFKFMPIIKEDTKGKGFTAITDGHLTFCRDELKDRSTAIVEVKASRHALWAKGKHEVDMQESAQMALWIAAEPDSHWIAPIQSCVGLNKGQGKSDMYYRVLVSQDRDEIFITLAQYHRDYVNYLQGKQATKGSFLKMWLFGPYKINQPLQMRILGTQISELLNYVGKAALEAFEQTPKAQFDHLSDDQDSPGGFELSDGVEEIEHKFSNLAIGEKEPRTAEAFSSRQPRNDLQT